ncbi:uncharacterized protein YbbC (DUF1343 family) [Ereboglobus sp. PH5-5]|uniref:DUF1343 domain-containing protein n=1 Tax=Ereboglobus sp. PH5-5 TaxID=2940529 RepID=UPI0024054615|nr:DUF1343 domain-containing protein [Ereboglobus sp. PH5-5]MDF9832708.1 uncharacterized protein YbbC (DUF1343 family) [Ereboglobus sp. PH5-5]
MRSLVSKHPVPPLLPFLATLVAILGLAGCTSEPTPADTRISPATTTQTPVITAPSPQRPATPITPANAASPVIPRDTSPAIMLGIDVLEAEGFRQIAGKRIGLLSHPAGVNRHGVSTIDVLLRAKNAKLVALFGPEHGIYGNAPASQNIADTIDKRTGLPAYSLYGKNRRPTKEQLKGLDALVIDMQDIGVRSYTFSVCMKYAIEACFEHGVEVIVLDRPNPLGGLKVDGPILDKTLFSGVGQMPIPYVHGLTMAELARMTVGTPGWLDVSANIKGRLTVVPMRGWRRAMRWPETGLRFVPTSPYIRDFHACVGYAMTGLGCQIGGFKHGIGTQFPFRGLSHKARSVNLLLRDLNALKTPGLGFRKITLTAPNGSPKGDGIFVEVTDWDSWRPTELSFHLMRLACAYNAQNPFAAASPASARSFNIHTGSRWWWNTIVKDGASIDVNLFLRAWHRECLKFQGASRQFWLYN